MSARRRVTDALFDGLAEIGWVALGLGDAIGRRPIIAALLFIAIVVGSTAIASFLVEGVLR